MDFNLYFVTIATTPIISLWRGREKVLVTLTTTDFFSFVDTSGG